MDFGAIIEPLLAAGAGAIAGSFLATLAVRWPRGAGVADGRSHCDSCGRTLAWWRLVPLVSYLVQRGCCADCGGAIDRRHPAMEAVCAGIAMLAVWIAPGPAGWSGALFGWLLATLALLDAEHLWLPDRLTLPLGLTGLVAGSAGLPPPLTDRLIGAARGGGVLWLIAWGYRRARGRTGMGAGDPKLLAAIGAWLGWAPLPWVVLGACALGLGLVLARHLVGRRVHATDRLPLGTLLAIAGWLGWCITAGAG